MASTTTTTTTTTTTLVFFDDIFRDLHNDMNIEDEVFDFDTIDMNVDDEEQAPLDHFDKDDNAGEERVLSQKLGQLSTTTLNETNKRRQDQDTISLAKKKMKKNHDQFNVDDIPDYLLVTNKSFEETILPILKNTGNPINIEQLRQQAILLHKLSIINLHKSLWNTYLRSGTGRLKGENQGDKPLLWPAHVESMMISKGLPIMTNENDIEHNVYIDFVTKYILQLNDKAEHYRTQYDTTKKSLKGYTNSIENLIEQFIQREGIAHIRLQFDAKTVLVEYDYEDRALTLEYFKLKPNPEQIEMAKRLCDAQYEKEKSHQELAWLKIGLVFHKKLPDSLDTLQISCPSSMETLADPILRDRLKNEYNRIIEQTKADLMRVYVSSAEAKKFECEKHFNNEMAQFWKGEQLRLPTQRWTKAMHDIIDRRRNNIIDCLKRIYAIKADFFVKAPMITLKKM